MKFTNLKGEEVGSYWLEKGDVLTTIPTVETKTGYTTKWSITDFEGISVDTTVTTVATAKTYTITYTSEDGAVLCTQEVVYDNQYVLYGTTSSDANKVFAYWKNAATGEKFKSKGVWTIDGDLELVAVFVENNSGDWTPNH